MSNDFSFLSTTHEIALIIEDDTDWDISIRSSQTLDLAAAFRHLLARDQHHSQNKGAHWSDLSSWDLLYPGHCDDLVAPSAYLTHPHVLYHDFTTPEQTLLHPATETFLESLSIPPHLTSSVVVLYVPLPFPSSSPLPPFTKALY